MDFVEKLDTFMETSTGVEKLQNKSMYESLAGIAYAVIAAKLRGISSFCFCKVAYFKYEGIMNKTLYIRVKYDDIYGLQDMYTKIQIRKHLGRLMIDILPDDDYIAFMEMTLS